MNHVQQIRESEQFIRLKAGIGAANEPEFGIILGTGLGGLVNDIEIEVEIPYQDIPHFPVSTVESHKGRLLFGLLNGRRIVAMQGRFHYYEGYSAQQVVFPVRVMKFLGIRRLFVSNAAGSLSETIGKGDLMVIRDHINLLPESPFRGHHDPELDPVFPIRWARMIRRWCRGRSISPPGRGSVVLPAYMFQWPVRNWRPHQNISTCIASVATRWA